MKSLALWLVLIPALVSGQRAPDGSARQEFMSGGTIRLHLEAGGYTVTSSESENIVVTCNAHSEEQLKRIKIEIKRSISVADVYVSDTPSNNFRATIEIPRRSNLWARLSAGEMVVEDLEGDKNVRLLAGRIQIDVPHPEQYGHSDASVTTGSIESSAFAVSKGGLFRSFEQRGPGRFRLHAHVTAGEIDLPGSP
jgi:hypothetical protein